MYLEPVLSSTANGCQTSGKAMSAPISVPFTNLLRQMINTLKNNNPEHNKKKKLRRQVKLNNQDILPRILRSYRLIHRGF
jgi:hypothetical protein